MEDILKKCCCSFGLFEVRVEHETCSTICGTPVQAILDQKNLTGLAGWVREVQNIVQNGPRFLTLEPSRGPY